MTKNLLLTGPPGSGKSALIRRLSDVFKEFNPAGFYVTEIKDNDQVTGFIISTLNGDSKLLAHINMKSKYTVGKYHVDIKGFELFLDTLFPREKKTGLFFVDEIGKFECLSKKFSKLIIELLDSEKPVIASIAEKGTGIISDIKKRSDVSIIEVSPYNIDLKLKELTMDLRDLLLE